MDYWDDASTYTGASSQDDTKRKKDKDFKLSRKIGKIFEMPGGVACPDCHTQLYHEEGHDREGAFCMGCAGDPGKHFHYVNERSLAARAAARLAAATAMTAMAQRYAQTAPTPRVGAIRDFPEPEDPAIWIGDMFKYDFEVVPAPGSPESMEFMDASTVDLDDVPL